MRLINPDFFCNENKPEFMDYRLFFDGIDGMVAHDNDGNVICYNCSMWKEKALSPEWNLYITRSFEDGYEAESDLTDEQTELVREYMLDEIMVLEEAGNV